MQEGTRHLWALSLNHLASINNTMKLLAGSSVKRSKQHIDLGTSRLTQDHTDWKRFKDWLPLKILTYTRFPQGSYLLQGKMK